MSSLTDDMKPIVGFPGYLISKAGTIWSTKRNKFKALCPNNRGHIVVRLADANGVFRTKKVHRLVAEAFIPNPKNLPIVNHIDGNPSNNSVENLEWSTYSLNQKHSYTVLGRKGVSGYRHPRSKQVIQLTLSGEAIAVYESSGDAQRKTKIQGTDIRACARGKLKTAGGYIWKYIEAA